MTPKHSSSPRSTRTNRGAALFAAVIFTGFSGVASADVDLVSVAMVGPGQAHVGSTVAVTVHVANFGDEPHSNFTAQVVLSEDAIVDDGDVIVGSITHDFLGYQSLMVDIPPAMPAGHYFWGFRVLPAGETDPLGNNATIGTEVIILDTDLELDDDSPIHFFWSPNLEETPEAGVVVSNVGSINSIVVFIAETLNPTPWLEVDAPSSFAVSGQDGNLVTLRALPAGLPLGTYEATLRFQNVYDVTDYEDLDISLTVGPFLFNPGDTIVGDIAGAGDADHLVVDVVKGERVVLKGRSNSGDLILRVNLIDPDGAFESAVKFKHTGEFVKKTAKFKRSGRYTVVIDGAKDTFGAYQIKTARKLPKKARPQLIKVKRPAGGGAAEVTVLALPGAILDFGLTPNAAFDGPVSVGCVSPQGLLLDIDDHSNGNASGGVVVEDLTIGELGAHRIRIDGFGDDAKAKVVLSIYPVQPKEGNAKIYLP